MDLLSIGRITETDIDEVVNQLGVRRFVEDDSIQNEPNADYVIGNAVLELKLVEEEGLMKTKRRHKIGQLFIECHSNCPVLVLDPMLLDSDRQRKYYDILAKPLLKPIQRAAKQLDVSATCMTGTPSRVLIVLNIGYTALDHEEFKKLAAQICRRNTSRIDSLIVGGVYSYSDGFTSYVFFPLEHIPINVGRTFGNFEAFRTHWCSKANELMTDLLKGTSNRLLDKAPVIDLVYSENGILLVKPSPQFGQPSEFWRDGRPRENSTGMEKLPAVGRTFPNIHSSDWVELRTLLDEHDFFKESYTMWCDYRANVEKSLHSLTCPFVPINVDVRMFQKWCQGKSLSLSYTALCSFVTERFITNTRNMRDSASSIENNIVMPNRYILVETWEIGRNLSYDVSSIYIVTEQESVYRRSPILLKERMFFQHALVLGAAYAIKFDVDVLFYHVDRTYGWV